MSTAQVLNLMVAPAALITANAVILRFNYERLAQIISRIRLFDEQVEGVIERKIDPLPHGIKKLLDRQVRTIRHETPKLLKSANRLQSAIFCYEASIISFGLTGLVAGLIFVVGSTAFPLALVCCGLGMVLLFLGIIYSIRDMAITLDPIQHEFNSMIEYTMEMNRKIIE
jgi:hypothetical protein